MLNTGSVLLQRLMQLSAADVHQLAASKLDADLLLDAIQELREQKVCPSFLDIDLPAWTQDCTVMVVCCCSCTAAQSSCTSSKHLHQIPGHYKTLY